MKGYKVTFNNGMKKPIAPIPYDGGEMSIQASEFHYCYPKSDEGPYEQFEVAVFNKKGKRVVCNYLEHYADDKTSDSPIYAYVPAGKIAWALLKDGYSDDNIVGIFDRVDIKKS